MAELETKEPGGDGRAGAASVRFQTALSFPTLSVGFNQGRQAVQCTMGRAERTSRLCSAPSRRTSRQVCS